MKNLLSAVAAAVLLVQPILLAAKDKDPVKISGPANAKNVTTVAVAGFNIGFIFESIDQKQKTGGLMGAFGGTTKAQSELVGVTPQMMQAITDAAYADFVRQMEGRGYVVQPAAELFGHAALAKAKPQAGPVDINITLEKGSKGKATYFKPSALPSLLMLPGDFTGSGMSSMGLNMAAGQAGSALSSYAKQAGVGVVNVVYLVDFSDQKRPGFFSFGGGINVNSGLSVAADFSRMTLIAPSGKQAVITMTAPVGVEGEFIEKSDASTGTEKAVQSTANVAGGLAAAAGIGLPRFGKTRKFQFTAKPGNYEEGAAKAASLASELLIGRLGALR
ncbi:MAG: hypothetical protein U0S50_04995 [Sphingopyxis sp.]|uniref:hypothetical protein n=1 Tax=Sphingopyxis sp. TaxID=1908224 RepID=UPI002ABBE302|nr:hypothetical protein [Sphingopyxis sp.]MDZ3831159.1 hypothetical protein [Sphingopyxis sp.]